MPEFLGIPLFGWISMAIGAIIVIFVLVKFLRRPKRKTTDGYLIKDVHVIVGDGSELFHQNVLIKDGIIQKIGGEAIDDAAAAAIDGRGYTLMPGLIDSHLHIQGGFGCHNEEESDVFLREKIPQIFSEGMLPFGITTIKDLDAPKHFIYKLRDKLRSGEVTGPELLIVGPNFTAPGGHPASTLGSNSPWAKEEMAIEVSTPEQVSAGIRELKEAGVDFLKFTYQGGDYWYFGEKRTIVKIGKDLMQQIIREGKENGLNSTAHVFYYDDVKELLEAGIYGIEHGILDVDIEPDDPIIALWKESGARFVPTVNAMTYENDPARLDHSLHNLKVLFDAGIPIAMGTDNMLESMTGEIEQRELAYYVEAGLSPMQAIILATKNGAEHLGIADRKGLVKEGMEADLILLEQNPAEDISNIKLIDKVFLRGRIVFSQKAISSYDIPEYSYPDGVSRMQYRKTGDAEARCVDVSGYADKNEITQVLNRGDAIWSEETFHVAGNLSCTDWHYARPSDQTELTARKDGEYIKLSGTFKGKAREKTYRIGDGLWYQMMDMALPAFVASEEQQIVFYSIGTGNNRGALELGEFAAEKAGEETVEVNGTAYDCVKVTLVLTAFSWAWTGLFWYDKESGQLVQTGEKGKGAEKLGYQLCKIE
ncbi:MAG: amidohydrolase family protein [Eggerthellaceae bacterium]|nr:amidohydrolase family protein [Eggerthellaceae bacterium]MBQ6390705.1 amidohydrolase family protein [Eggerthellaceae bacterium]